MTLWIARYGARMLAVLLAMLLVEFGSYFFAIETGVNRLFWVPVSFGLVAYAGYDTVGRLPLIWGVLVGAMLAGSVSILSLLVGSFVIDGHFRMPAEAEPLLLLTTLLMTSLIGAIIGGAAGVLARSRRRHRARRSAIRKLAYTANDESAGPSTDIPPRRTSPPMPTPTPMPAPEPRVERPFSRAAEGL